MFKVTLKRGHPTGTYRRAGIEFTSSAPVILPEVPEAVAKDSWLTVTEVESDEDDVKTAAKVKSKRLTSDL